MSKHGNFLHRVHQQCITILLLLGTVVTGLAADPNPTRTAQAWLHNSIIYEIFPRNFSASGDFNGITARLDDLKALGVDVLWLMPVHPIGEKLKKGSIGSPYAVQDYYALNPNYGTTADFDALVSAAHQRGLKVIIDIVANHTAWDSVMMKHPEFYKHDANGKIQSPADWYDVAWLNYEEPKLRRYMIDMLKYWVRERHVDGFRCDVAYMVPTDFWEQARAELEQINPNIMMLAEASHPELLRKAFDIDYSWPLHATLNRVMIEGAPASDLRASWEESREQFPAGAMHLRISDNHDEARAVARFGIRGALATQVLMLTLDGVPLFYNGMEVGDATESGAPALFEKLPIYWEPKERPPLRDIYQDLIKLRKSHLALTQGDLVWLRNSAETDLVTFLRMDAKDEFVVVINLSNRPVVGSVNVMHAEQFKPVRIAGTPEVTGNSFPLFRLNGFEWRIYRRGVR